MLKAAMLLVKERLPPSRAPTTPDGMDPRVEVDEHIRIGTLP
jgi:hypothetical protein